ncbi:MAG: LEA type 2 family protein [Leptospiraceae bacterium]|nr:LEA type 2 family protein [Leptospiraceae bacterium]MCP5498127.1 LEA type 2 family protein [Leptospiraceae bacterium]
MKLINNFLYILIFCIFASCQFLQQKLADYAPDILFKTANLKGIDLAGANIDFTFLAKNKAPIPIDFSSIKSQIFVDGKKLFNADIPQGLQLKANDTSDFTVSQRIDFKDVTSNLIEFFKKDTIDVKIDGISNFSMGKFGNKDIPFTANKSVPVPKLPTIKFGSFDFKKQGSSLFDPSALFDLKFSIANPNAFGIDLNFIKYSLTADNKNLLDGQAPALQLASKAEKEYNIPITLRGKEILSMLPKLKNFSSMNYNFNGNMNLNAGQIPLDLPYSYP